MATVANMNLSIVRQVANAEITLTYDIVFSSFDQATDLAYFESWRLIGDDTGQDGEDGVAGDDAISMGFTAVATVSSNGAASIARTKTKTLAWSALNEDTGALFSDDEIRAVVTLTPQLPAVTSRESAMVLVTAP